MTKMSRKRRASMPSYIEDEGYGFEDEYDKEEFDNRAPRNAANARERARMRVLSRAFCRLKTTLPWVPADTKLSKLDTLRLASTYIAHLRAILRDDGDTCAETTRSLSLTLSWPFAVQNSGIPILTDTDCEKSPTTTCSIPTSVPDRGYESHHKIQNLYQFSHETQPSCLNYNSHMLRYYKGV